MNRVMKMAASLAIVVLLCGFESSCKEQVNPPPKNTRLPPMPADLKACLQQYGVEIPDRDLTVADVERFWKEDRRRIVVMRQCGSRFVAWYASLRKKWK